MKTNRHQPGTGHPAPGLTSAVSRAVEATRTTQISMEKSVGLIALNPDVERKV
jgi:hypothetical protein